MFFRYPGFDFTAFHCSPSVAESTASLVIGVAALSPAPRFEGARDKLAK
jgi:hypothetical protein